MLSCLKTWTGSRKTGSHMRLSVENRSKLFQIILNSIKIMGRRYRIRLNMGHRSRNILATLIPYTQVLISLEIFSNLSTTISRRGISIGLANKSLRKVYSPEELDTAIIIQTRTQILHQIILWIKIKLNRISCHIYNFNCWMRHTHREMTKPKTNTVYQVRTQITHFRKAPQWIHSS